MRAGDFVRKIRRLGRTRGVTVRFIARRGKGSHGTLYYGQRFTVVPDRKRELEGVKKSGLSQARSESVTDMQGLTRSAADCPSIFSHLPAHGHPRRDARSTRSRSVGSDLNMTDFRYPAVFKPEPQGGFTVRFRELPEAITHGDDRADALAQAADCLEEAIANRIVAGLGIPPPSTGRRGTVIPLAPMMAAKAALYLAIRNAGVSNVEMARRLGVDEKEVRRMLDPRHATKLARIQAALALLGKRLVVSVEEAA